VTMVIRFEFFFQRLKLGQLKLHRVETAYQLFRQPAGI
jgi:hypothetical protein